MQSGSEPCGSLGKYPRQREELGRALSLARSWNSKEAEKGTRERVGQEEGADQVQPQNQSL